MSTWTQDELRRFLAAARDHPLHCLWVFAATTGVRRSEVLGVRWTDINVPAATVSIRQTVISGPEGYRLEVEQKSVASGRTLHLSRRTLEALSAQRTIQLQHRRDAGPAWLDFDLVFPRDDGRWWNPPAISLAFRRAVKRAGIAPIRLHDSQAHPRVPAACGARTRRLSPSGSGTARSPSPSTPTPT